MKGFTLKQPLKLALALVAAALALAAPASARGRSHHYPHSSGSSDYARPVGSASDPVLSTGWTGGHGARTEHVGSYYRHTKSGGLVHVHSYYRRHH